MLECELVMRIKIRAWSAAAILAGSFDPGHGWRKELLLEGSFPSRSGVFHEESDE